MNTVQFSRPALFTFVAAYLRDPSAIEIVGETTSDAASYTVTTHDALLAEYLRCMISTEVVFLPFAASPRDTWLLAATTPHALMAAQHRVSRFFAPSYGVFDTQAGLLRLRYFDPHHSAVQVAGAAAFPSGYYLLRVPYASRTDMRRRAAQWARLERIRHELPPPVHRSDSYRELYERFRAALTATAWEQAENALTDIQQQYLTSAENVAFLQVQLAAQRGEWARLWREFVPNLARMRVPRLVRAALLTAFHHEVLRPLEERDDWPAALAEMRAALPSLGTLLDTRLALTQEPVVRTFAFHAVLLDDGSRLHTLREASSDPRTLDILNALDALITPVPPPIAPPLPAPLLSVTKQAQRLLAERDYEGAAQITRTISDDRERVVLLLRIADLSGDVAAATNALVAFDALPTHERELFAPIADHAARMIAALTGITDPEDTIAQSAAITDWATWFERAAEGEAHATLDAARTRLSASVDDRFFVGDAIQRTAYAMLDFWTNPIGATRRLVQRAVQDVTNLALNDEQFPRNDEAFKELYEALYQCIIENPDRDSVAISTLLQIARVVLAQGKMMPVGALPLLTQWFDPPRPAHEEYALDALELLIDYGLSANDHPDVTSWFRRWVEHLLELPPTIRRGQWYGWLSLGKWLQTVPDLVERLEAAIPESGTDTFDAVASLPKDYRIGIFTLRPASAERVQAYIRERNLGVIVEVCADTHPNEQAIFLAKGADMVVLVTTCMTHAMSYGIRPYIKDPVYPASSGSTSIVRAIERRLN